MKKTVMFIDPPTGWMYGFPKPAPENIRDMTQAQLHEWFVANGYPQKELDIWKNSENGMPCGMFESEVEDSDNG
jgi:hypothetical protein